MDRIFLIFWNILNSFWIASIIFHIINYSNEPDYIKIIGVVILTICFSLAITFVIILSYLEYKETKK